MIHSRLRPDDGETLIEILVAIVVMGIAATGLIAGLSSGIVSSDSHRRLSSAETVVRAYGELLKNRILHPATTTVTQDVPPFSNGDTVVVHVADLTSFTESVPYDISLDGVIMTVTSTSSGSLTMTAKAQGSSLGVASGDLVQRYASCPGSSTKEQDGTDDSHYFDSVLSGHPELTEDPALQAPKISSSGITFYSPGNVAVTAANCATYFSSAGTSSCSGGTDHRTECDPPWMRISIEVDESSTARKTCATSGSSKICAATDVIIRRVS